MRKLRHQYCRPAFTPGSGKLEVGGLISFQALEVVRGLQGMKIVGADLVAVSPRFDPVRTTAWRADSSHVNRLWATA